MLSSRVPSRPPSSRFDLPGSLHSGVGAGVGEGDRPGQAPMDRVYRDEQWMQGIAPRDPDLRSTSGTIWDPGSSSNLGRNGDIQIQAKIAQIHRMLQQVTASVHHLRATPYKDALLSGVPAQRDPSSCFRSDPLPLKPIGSQPIPPRKRELGKNRFLLLSPRFDQCFRCGEKGHFARECRNAVVCFVCGSIGHRSWQCGGQQLADGAKAHLNPDPPKAHLEIDPMKQSALLFFDNTPDSRLIEEQMKKSVVLHTEQEFTADRVLRNLRRQAPNFPWKVAEMAEYKLLVEGPNWWRDKVIRQEVAKIEWANLRALPWSPSFENGNRLKSLWVRVVGFPTKLWSRREFERLMEGFGTILEIDQRTMDRTYLVEANIRIGVCRFEDVPLTRQVVFRNDRGEKCWTDVKFLFEIPGNLAKQNRHKRQRVWVPKDPSPSNSAPPNTDTSNKQNQNTGNEEDLLDEEADSQRLSEEAYEDVEIHEPLEKSGVCEGGVSSKVSLHGPEQILTHREELTSPSKQSFVPEGKGNEQGHKGKKPASDEATASRPHTQEEPKSGVPVQAQSGSGE